MKTLVLSVMLLVCSLAAAAQANPDSTIKSLKRVYVGVEISGVPYSMWDPVKKLSGGITPILHLHAGYKLSQRVNLQIGLTYGREREDRLSGIYYGYNDTIIYHFHKSEMKGVAMPITIQINPFRTQRKLRVSATASLAPIIGSVWHQYSEEYEGTRKVTYEDEDAGIYLVATAGVQLNYKISNRLDAFGKVNLMYKDILNYSYFSFMSKSSKSIGIGLNYNFNLKRGK